MQILPLPVPSCCVLFPASMRIQMESSESENVRAAEVWKQLLQQVEISTNGSRCGLESHTVALSENDGISIAGKYSCGVNPEKVSVRIQFFPLLTEGHRHLASVDSQLVMAYAANPEIRITAKIPSSGRSAISFFVMGLEHILTGY